MSAKAGTPLGMMYYYSIIRSSLVSTYVQQFSPQISHSLKPALCRISITVTLANEQQPNRGVACE